MFARLNFFKMGNLKHKYNLWLYKTLFLYNFQDGMGKLRITDQGLKHYGEAEFVDELRANLIRPSQVRYCKIIMYHCVGLYLCYHLVHVGSEVLLGHHSQLILWRCKKNDTNMSPIHVTYQTWKTVWSHLLTPRREWKIWRVVGYFWQTLGWFEMWLICSIKTRPNEKIKK